MKAVFFDIDGTLWDVNSVIPESTVEAIHALQKNGHMAFINTGRTRAFIRRRNLLDIGFDGICCGCGTMLEIDGKAEYYYRIPEDFAVYTVETIRKYAFRPVLEGRYHLYLDDEDFAEDFFGMKLKEEMGEDLWTIKDHWGDWEISKFSCSTPQPEADVEAAKQAGMNEYITKPLNGKELVNAVAIAKKNNSNENNSKNRNFLKQESNADNFNCR